MQTGKSIKSTLADKLDKLDLSAGSTFRKEKTWERLQLRLDSRKRGLKKRAFILALSVPAAAAVFYFLIGLGNNKTVEKINHTVTTKPEIATAPKTATLPSAPTTSLPFGKKVKIATPDKKHAEEIKIEEPFQVAITEPPLALKQDTTVAPNAVATIPVAQKKLRVVHNNELVGPVAPPADERNVAAIAGRSHLILGFRTQGLDSFEEFPGDTIRKHKSKSSILPFSSLISQKE